MKDDRSLNEVAKAFDALDEKLNSKNKSAIQIDEQTKKEADDLAEQAEKKMTEALASNMTEAEKSEYLEKDGQFKKAAGGSRFDTCVKWAKGKGADNPEGLCAYIGRKAGKIP